MKKATYLIVLLALSITVKAQKSAQFNFRYLPKHQNKLNMKMDMGMNMDLGGDSAQIAKLKAEGAPANMVMDMNMNAVTTMITGTPKADKNFPFTMTYSDFTTKMKMNGTEMNTPSANINGKSISGECDAAGNLHVDTVGLNVDPKINASVMEMMNKMQKQIKFPDKPLAIGESFTQEIPLNMPITGMNMDLKMKTSYTLTAIKEGKGYFDMVVTMNFGMDADRTGANVNGKGTAKGTGKVVFDIAQHYPVSMISDIDMDLVMSVNPQKINMKMKMKSDVQNEIIKTN